MASPSLPAFIARWQRSSISESGAYQTHFNELCALLGQPTPPEADPSGQTYAFQKGVRKAGGGEGWADVWKKDCFAWEYKSKGKNLKAAYQQLLQYREDLENPPLLVTCDFNRFEVHTNFNNSAKQVYSFTLADLGDPGPLLGARYSALDTLRYLFTEPEKLRPEYSPSQVTEKAAAEFAALAQSLRRYGTEADRAARFLVRLLFCLFAQDVGLLPDHLFTRLVDRHRYRSVQFSQRLKDLFKTMVAGGPFGAEEIPAFDGGLFADDNALDMASDDIEVLARACRMDWASIEPAILGTLFERSLNDDKRSQLGAHYTTREDIMLLVEPVLMSPRWREWEDTKRRAEDLSTRREAAQGKTREELGEEIRAILIGFANRLANIRVLDPASGSGNFLYVALKQLLDLEKRAITLAASLGLDAWFPLVNPQQLHGMEINPYAHELAQAAIWIGYLQWLRDNGFEFRQTPILKPLDNVLQMDAILAYDGQSRPVEPQWPEADVIVGNPPFLGGNRVRQGLGDSYVDALFRLYEGRVPRFADLVCYWFERTRELIAAGKVKRAGLLATQGIRGGANRRVLERIKETGDIFMAWSDRDWIQDGVAVHVSMVGFDDGSQTSRCLDGCPVSTINADLTSTIDLTTAVTLKENLGISYQGPSAKSPFDIDRATAQKMLGTPLNVNGRPNSDVVRPVASAVDLVQGSRFKWTVDFGLMDMQAAAQYELPFEYVKEHVYPVRSINRRQAYAEKWWQYAEARPGMRRALRDKQRYIATPCHAKHRIFVWVDAKVLCNQATIVFAREDDYFFGVLQSEVHELWARATGTQVREAESGFRYTPTTTFETFPFPWRPGREPQGDPRVEAIARTAGELVDMRDRWLNPEGATDAQLRERTLTNLYNHQPEWLKIAHRKLDEAVLDSYGWPRNLADGEIVERLLELNLARAADQV